MILIPAIDLQNGKCVRLRQGDMNESTVFSDDPLAMAERWVEAGARRLHIVDLDGAIKGDPVNADVIHRIAENYPTLPIQVGGGIRCAKTIDIYVQAGVRYVIIGTHAVNEPHLIRDLCAEFPTRIIVGLDAKENKVFTDGWSKSSNHSVIDLAQQFDAYGVESIVYTDIARDGMMQGVNIDATIKLAESINIPVIASGGIHNIENLKKLAEKNHTNIIGAITGRAIYEGKLDFSAGQAMLDDIAGDAGLGL